MAEFSSDRSNPAAPPGEPPSTLTASLMWLVRLRWVATAGLLGIVTVVTVGGFVDSPIPLFAIVTVLAIGNLFFGRLSKPSSAPPSEEWTHRVISTQILFDLALLTATLYWSGNTDNPFRFIYVFHMAIAGMLLPMGRALLLGLAACAMHGAVLIAQAHDIVPHHSLVLGSADLHRSLGAAARWRSPTFIGGYLAAFSAAQLGVLYFVGLVARQQRRAEARRREHERIALSRERLARIGGVTAGVAHTVRNPLHGLMNCVDILRRQQEPTSSNSEVLDLMEEGVGRIERVTGRLLTLSREDPFHRTPTSVHDLIEDASSLSRVTARDRGVNLEVDVDDLPLLPLDGDRFVEALVNVIDNAVQASASGDTVIVRASTRGDDPNWIRIEILDQGSGIPAEFATKVFDPFFTTKPIGEGTGLGLAITRRVVEEHEGNITLAGREGRGTRVNIDLPLQPESLVRAKEIEK